MVLVFPHSVVQTMTRPFFITVIFVSFLSCLVLSATPAFDSASEVFLAGNIGQCRSHPLEACFSGEGGGPSGGGGVESEAGSGGADGHYPCCKKPAYR